MNEEMTYLEHLQNARKRGSISKDDYEYGKLINEGIKRGRLTEVLPLPATVKEKTCTSWREQNNNSYRLRLEKMA